MTNEHIKTTIRPEWTLACFLVAALNGVPAAAQDDAMASLMGALEIADYGQRADFARLALEEVITAYEQVLDGSTMAVRSLGGKSDLRRWRAATNRFVTQLQDARWRLEQGADVQMNLGPDGTVVLFVGRQPVLLSGPDAADTERLQRTVVAQFCAMYSCAAMQENGGGQPVLTQAAGDHWSFDQDRRPAFVLGGNISFLFASISQRPYKERLSRQLTSELHTVAEELRSAARAGRRVHWQQLQLLPRRDGSLEWLQLNDGGTSLSLSAPLLSTRPTLWREALPWLRAQALGEDYALTFWNADALLRSPEPPAAWIRAQR